MPSNLTLVSDEEVEKFLMALSVSTATGVNSISSKFLKHAAEVISLPLAYIIHLSLKGITVPEDFKMARIVPMYKNGDKTYEGNYRLVSILPAVSKILERIAHNQMSEYLWLLIH